LQKQAGNASARGSNSATSTALIFSSQPLKLIVDGRALENAHRHRGDRIQSA